MAAAPTTANDFLDLVRKAGIVSASDLDSLTNTPPEPTACAASLISKGYITKFQAKLLLSGRYKGFKLGHYIVKEQIGQGGMGAVYLGEHETLRRKVALKVLTPPKDSKEGVLAIERFLREARAAAALDHPNIVRLHDIGREGNTQYLVMEYVEGQTLDQLMNNGGPISPSRAVGYIAQAAAGLQQAFEKGFVHRDIKPGNLMLAKDGTIKILDMGLAKPSDNNEAKLTEILDKGAIVGTADFISPEQAMNAPVDIRGDIYSLGATFFALVTGSPPFHGSTTQKLIQHQMKEAPTLTTLDKTFPNGLSKVVAKMLEKKPKDRYQSPAELIAALAEWLPVDGGRKVVAGLSGASSKELENTLSEVESATQRFNTQTRLAIVKSKRKKLIIGGIAAGVVAIGGLVAVLAGGSKKEGAAPVVKRENPPEDVKPNTPEKKNPAVPKTAPKVEPTPKTPVVQADPNNLVSLPVARVEPFVLHLVRNEKAPYHTETMSGAGKMPVNWFKWVEFVGTEAEIFAEITDDGPAIGTRVVNGKGGLSLNSPEIKAAAGTKVLLTITYKTSSEFPGGTVRLRPKVGAAIEATKLPPTGDSWKTITKEVELFPDMTNVFEIAHPGVGPQQELRIKSFEVKSINSGN